MKRVLETIAAVLVLAMMLGVLGYTGWFWTGGGVDMGMCDAEPNWALRAAMGCEAAP